MRRLFTTVSLLAVFAFLALPLEAQTRGAARGHVVDDQKQPVADAKIVIELVEGVPAKFEVKTDKKGGYMQVGLAPGRYRIVASKEGFVDAGLEMRIGRGLATDIPELELNSKEGAASQPNAEAELIQAKFAEGVKLAQDGQLDEAEVLFNEILALQPGVPEAYNGLGFIYAQRKDWAQAEQNYLSALDLRPGDPEFTGALAKVYQDSGQEEKAAELMSQAAANNPEDAVTQLNQGVFLLNSGQNVEAQAAFEAALAADPSLSEAHYHLGTILVGQGKVPESIEHLEVYLASGPKNEQYAATAQGLIQALKQ
jgi:Flp pilus assembly protein TadD